MAIRNDRSGSGRKLSNEDRRRREYERAFIDVITSDDMLEDRVGEHMRLVDVEEDCRDRGIRLNDA